MFEGHIQLGVLCHKLAELSGHEFLRKDGVGGEDEKQDKCGSPDYQDQGISYNEPRDECRVVVCVQGPIGLFQ